MSVKEAVKAFNKHENTILRWINEGKLIAEKDPGGRDWWIKGIAPVGRRQISEGIK